MKLEWLEEDTHRGIRDQPQPLPAGENDGLLPVPGLVVSHDFGMQCHIMWGQLRQLVGLGVDPSQWLHVLVKWESQQCSV